MIEKIEYSEFLATIRKVGGNHVLTIPIKNIKFEGWEVGDELKVVAKKVEFKK